MSWNVRILRGGGFTLPDGLTYYAIDQIVTLSDQQYAQIAPSAFTNGYLQSLGQIFGNSSSGGGVVTPTQPTINDATTASKGVAKILGGTADAPTVPWSAITNSPNIPALYSNLSGQVPLTALTLLPAAARSGSYNDLSNRPNIPAAYVDLTGQVPLAALTLLPAAAKSGAYSDMTGQVPLTALTLLPAAAKSGAYNDLTGKPTIPAVYGDLSGQVPIGALSALPTVARSGAYADLSGKPTIPSAYSDLSGQVPLSALSLLPAAAKSGSYIDLINRPTIPATYSDLTGTVPQSALPAVALTEFLGTAASQSAMLALVGQRGDRCTRTDLGTDWYLIADDSSQITSWRQVVYPSPPVISVNGRNNQVTGLAELTDVTTAMTGRQPLNTGLTAIAALNPNTSGMISSDGSGWISKTYAQVKTALVLVAGDVGLGNVTNTSDASKPVSTAQQTALDLKANDSAVAHNSGNETWAGIKTFSASPIVPTATTASQAANLGNITSAIAASGGGGGADATTTTKGVARILGGTADAPTVPYSALTGAPSLATVATSGAYIDLTGKPTIPTAPGDIGAQVADSDLTVIAALDSTVSGMLATDGSGWTRKTYAQVKAALGVSSFYMSDSPAKHGLAEWNYDPIAAGQTTTNATAFTSGTYFLAKITPQTNGTINNIIVQVLLAGSSLTSGQNLVAICDMSGTRLGITGDQSTAWTSTGLKTMALTAGVAVTAGTDYYIVLLSVGSTPPKFSQGPGTIISANAGLGLSVLRFATNETGKTSIGTTVNMSNNTGSNAITFWCALSN